MSTSKVGNVEFSLFITQVLFYMLDRLPSTFTLETERSQMEKHFQTASNFIHRILKCTESSIPFPIILLALKYIHRLASSGNQNPCYGSEGHIFLFALITAQKVHADHCYTNASWSRISRTDIKMLLKMEFEFLDSLDWNLNVDKAEYVEWFGYVQGLAKRYKTTVKDHQSATEFKMVNGIDESAVMATPEL